MTPKGGFYKNKGRYLSNAEKEVGRDAQRNFPEAMTLRFFSNKWNFDLIYLNISFDLFTCSFHSFIHSFKNYQIIIMYAQDPGDTMVDKTYHLSS